MSGNIINSSSFSKALWPGVNAWFGQAYSQYPEEWNKLFEKYTSQKAFEEDVGVSTFGLATVKGEGAPIQMDAQRQSFITRYPHIVYALGFAITQEMYEDDQYGVAAKKGAQALAFSMKQTKEIIAANVFNRGFNSSYAGGDGSAMIATNHANWVGGTWSNRLSVDSDLSEAALEQACIDIAGFTDDRGKLIAVRPKKLVIARQNMFEAQRILGSDGRVGTELNDINAIKSMGMIPEIVTNHYLTDADAWFIITDAPDGLKYFERKAMTFGTDNDSSTKNAIFTAQERYSFGFTDPRAVYGSPGA